jgi:nucleotide-binding universal stress UspA family protein
MYRVVMVPTDGSEWSRHAIPLALAVARPAKAELHLVAVLEPTFEAPIYGVPIASVGWTGAVLMDTDASGESRAARREAQASALREFAERLAADAGVAVTASLEEGDIVTELRRHAETRGADLIVMATHGRGGLARAVLGSVADAVVHSVSCPVLLARPHGELPPESEAASIAHMLVPLDGSVESDTIVPRAAELSAVTGARCTVAYVSHPELLGGIAAPAAMLDPAAARRGEDAEKEHLERMAELFRARSTAAVDTVLLRVKTPADAIVDYAGTHAVDLIAMTTHARHGLSRLMHGSTATALLSRTRLPMLLARSDMSSDMSPR